MFNMYIIQFAVCCVRAFVTKKIFFSPKKPPHDTNIIQYQVYFTRNHKERLYKWYLINLDTLWMVNN